MEEEMQRLEGDDSLNEVIMAIDMKERGTIGCAYYVAREEKLCMMEDVKLAGLDIVDNLKIHAQPTVILISSRAEETLEDHLSKEARERSRSDEESKSSKPNPRFTRGLTCSVDDIFGSYVLESRISNDFSYEAAKNKLANLDILGVHSPEVQFATPGDHLGGNLTQIYRSCDVSGAGRQARLMRLAGCIDLQSHVAVCKK
jgi:DNA mismatch repair protein MSH5